MAYIKRETSLVRFDCKILITWGKNEQVVQVAAIKPIMVTQSNLMFFYSTD